MRLSGFLASVALGALATAQKLSTQQETPILGKFTPQGCFTSAPDDLEPVKLAFNSPGMCADKCTRIKKPVAILQGRECACSEVYPAASALTAGSDCDFPCPGYAMEACGGSNGDYASVYNTGLVVNVAHAGMGEETDSTGYVALEKLLALASGAWSRGSGMAAGVMSQLCMYIDCGSTSDTESQKPLGEKAD